MEHEKNINQEIVEAYKTVNDFKFRKYFLNAYKKASPSFGMTTHYLIREILKDEDLRNILQGSGWSEKHVKELEKILEKLIEKMNSRIGSFHLSGEDIPPEISSYMVDVVSDAFLFAYKEGWKTLEPWHVMYVYLKNPKEDFVKAFILKYGINVEKILSYVKNNSHIKESSNQEYIQSIIVEMEKYARNLNKLAESGNLDPLIGREKELYDMQETLCRRIKNNVLIVGHPGTGKTALVEGLATKVVNGEVPDKIKNAIVFSLSVGDILAGTKFRGDMEQKLKEIFDMLEKMAEGGFSPILFIDEIHGVIGSGTGSGESRGVDIANILKPVLTKGKIRIIGATTHDELNRFIDKDSAFKRRFQIINVDEPSFDEAVEILKGLRKRFEEYHGVEYSDKAIEAAVKYSVKFMKKTYLPDKAIDLIDKTGARFNLLNYENRKVDEDEIIKSVSSFTGLSVEKIKGTDKKIKNLEEELKKRVFGQDHVINEVSEVLYVNLAGLKERNKPDGVFFFNGPTGTGKTELAKSIAEVLDIPFHRIDMSEFMEQHTVSKLIGAPPGYVGYSDTDGILFKIIEESPHCVVLLDEIEKAHPDVWNIFLQIFDNGKLTNSKGKQVFFDHVIFVITGNVGSRMVSKMEIGFNRGEKGEEVQEEEVKRIFPPEFLNRFDIIVTFKPLDKEISLRIVDKFLKEIKEMLKDKNVDIEFDESVYNYFVEKGFDKTMGARPLKRIIDKELKVKIAKTIYTRTGETPLKLKAFNKDESIEIEKI